MSSPPSPLSPHRHMHHRHIRPIVSPACILARVLPLTSLSSPLLLGLSLQPPAWISCSSLRSALCASAAPTSHVPVSGPRPSHPRPPRRLLMHASTVLPAPTPIDRLCKNTMLLPLSCPSCARTPPTAPRYTTRAGSITICAMTLPLGRRCAPLYTLRTPASHPPHSLRSSLHCAD